MVTVINLGESTQYRNFTFPTLAEILSAEEYEKFQRREVVVIDPDLNLIKTDEVLRWCDTVYITTVVALRDHLEHKLRQLEEYLKAVQTYETHSLQC